MPERTLYRCAVPGAATNAVLSHGTARHDHLTVLCCAALRCAVQYLAPPHVILRHGMTQGDIYPLLADHLARFLATTLVHTSLLAISTEQLRWVLREG